jgi:hypothetical protein
MRRMGAGKTAAAVATLVAVVAGTTGPFRAEAAGSGPADVPFTSLHLPKVVNTPGTWSGDEGPDGPLAAVGLALRTSPQGLSGERQHLQLFGVSAVDGRARWISLPGVKVEDEALVGWFALSPDGRWIGWSRHREGVNAGVTGRLLGWSVMNTTTRKVRRLADATHPLLRETAWDLVFSGDSRYLLTNYETRHAPRTRGHRFVAWDVKDGSSKVLEEPGHYWLPDVGSAPSGVVWSRGRTVYRDAATGDRSSYSLPKWVVTASWAPDSKAFAYIGRSIGRPAGRWRLYAGRSLEEARAHVLPLDVQPGQLLGWRDNRHVVVGHFRRTVHVVDVVTGHAVALDLAGQGEPLNAPLVAADLWRNPLVAPVEPDGTSDPRQPFRWGGGALAALAGALVLRRKRRSA